MSSGLTHGFRRGDWTTAGLILGVNIGALVATSTTLFSVITWAGVAYLADFGVQQWRAPVTPMLAGQIGGGARRCDLVLRGWMVNTINPKGTVCLLVYKRLG
jgi:homoserine/homoserine lactone efflux protein